MGVSTRSGWWNALRFSLAFATSITLFDVTQHSHKADGRHSQRSASRSVLAQLLPPVNMPRRPSREQMLSAAAGVTDDNAYQPKSVQMAPGKRGERPPSYRTGMAAMNKKIDALSTPKSTPTALWFIAGALMMGALYLFNAFSASGQ